MSFRDRFSNISDAVLAVTPWTFVAVQSPLSMSLALICSKFRQKWKAKTSIVSRDEVFLRTWVNSDVLLDFPGLIIFPKAASRQTPASEPVISCFLNK